MSWGELRERILSRIRPTGEEERLVHSFCQRVSRELSERLREAGFKAVAEVHGSVAKGTWLSGERDVDIFILLDIPGPRPKVCGHRLEWYEAHRHRWALRS